MRSPDGAPGILQPFAGLLPPSGGSREWIDASSTRSSMLARLCAVPSASHNARISARPDPHAFGLIFTPIDFHRRTRPSCNRSDSTSQLSSEALVSGAVGLNGWSDHVDQTWLLGFIPDSDPCTAAVAFSDPLPADPALGFASFRIPRTLARKRLIVQPLHRSTGLRLRGPCPFMGLIHRASRGEQAMPPTARVVWISLQRFKRSMPRRFLTLEVGRWFPVASVQVRRRRLPV